MAGIRHEARVAATFCRGLLLRFFLSTDAQEALVGDMREEYARRRANIGFVRAWLWYWRETISALANFGGRRPSEHRIQGDPYVRSFFTDLRVGTRALFNAPLSSTLSILTLALGIGAIGAVFSVVNPILLRPLPYPDPDRLVLVSPLDPSGNTSNIGFATFDDIRRDVGSMRAAAAMGSWRPTIAGASDAERVNGQRVSWNYFRVLGVRPAVGRDFVESEDAPGQRVVILSHGLWLRHYGGDSSVVGRTIDIEGTAHIVAGVMGADFENVASPTSKVWRTLSYASNQQWACRTCQHLRMIARLPQETSFEAASADLNRAGASLLERFPKEYLSAGIVIASLKARMTAPYKDALFVLFAAAALLALIAAANVVNLQLARAMQREGVLAIRMMLGASRARIMRLLFAEGFILAALSGIAGGVLAFVFVPMFAASLPAGIPRLDSVRVDATTVALLIAFSFVVAMTVTLLPAVRLDTRRMGGLLRVARRVVGHGSATIRRALVIGEVALALMLLVGTGLLTRSLSALLAVDSGVKPAGLLTLEIQAAGNRYSTDDAVWNNHAKMLEVVRGIPGVTAAGLANQLPLSGNVDMYGVRAFDKPLDNTPQLIPSADRYTVSPDFMGAMGIRVLRGRGFEEADNRADASPVALVSAALAERIWPGENAIGKKIRVGELDSPWREVVGIVANVRHRGLEDETTRQFYVPERQWPWSEAVVTLALRSDGDPATLIAPVRNAVRNVDPSQPIMRILPMTDVVAESIGQRRLAFALFAVFAGVALLMAAAGVYGVLATSVTARAREIGVRSALGATPARLVGLVARDSAWLIGVGTIVGLAGVVALSRFLNALLFGIGPTDPTTIVVVTVGVIGAAMCAAVLPAMRAARTDPVQVLRGD